MFRLFHKNDNEDFHIYFHTHLHGDAKPIPSTARLMVWIMFVDRHSFSLPLVVQRQVPRFCTLPEGSPDQPDMVLPQARHRLLAAFSWGYDSTVGGW